MTFEHLTLSQWMQKMRNAGATYFNGLDGDDNFGIVSAYKHVNGSHIPLGDYDEILKQEIFHDNDKYDGLTESGCTVSYEIWKEKVLCEGSTRIESKNKYAVAYKHDSRIGVFELKEKKMKKFEDILNESMQVSTSYSSTGDKSITITADGDDAVAIAELIKLSGIASVGHTEAEQDTHYHVPGQTSCDQCGVQEEYGNKPSVKYVSADTQLNAMSGGLNRPKKQVNPNNAGDNPLAMKPLGTKGSGQLNIAEDKELVDSLWNQYQQFVTESEHSEKDDPRAKGYFAGYKGKSIEKCPYEPKTKEKTEWEEGWKEGRDEMKHKSR
jgi:ribosome modulation factor